MSKNIICTKVQHVFKYLPPDYVEVGAPFLAVNKEMEKDGEKIMHYQFLGEGYYFWDDNIGRAHRWGRSHYEGNYGIQEGYVELKGEKFLDLVGSRKDLKDFVKIYEKIRGHFPNQKLGAFFNGVQQLERKQPGTFPFSIIRILNLKRNQKKVSFRDGDSSQMLLDPEIIICFYDKKEINLQEESIEIYKDNGH